MHENESQLEKTRSKTGYHQPEHLNQLYPTAQQGNFQLI